MLKKLEIILSILVIGGLLGYAIPSFVQGMIDGYKGIEGSYSPSNLFKNIWHLSAILYCGLRIVRYRKKQ